MKDFFYRSLMFLTRRLGAWIFLLLAWPVATGHFLFFPRRVAVSVRFYRRLFPERGRWHALWCAWRQYHHFVHPFLDRILLEEGVDMETTYEGWEHITAAAESGRGGIILMSHVGGWEIAAQLLSRYGRKYPRFRLLLYLGEKHREQIERRQKRSVAQSGIRVVAVPKDGGTPLDILEGLTFLREGGLVSLTGDRLWGRRQRGVTVRFAGGEARIPEMPYILSLLSGSPILISFVHRTGRRQYHFVTGPPLPMSADSRSERRKAVETAAQRYADLLERTVRAHPEQWYHFEPFLRDDGDGDSKRRS
ncbi:MAG: lysophospholipid acyltransferase family protein [Thermodesulfobacteriota bacterium]